MLAQCILCTALSNHCCFSLAPMICRSILCNTLQNQCFVFIWFDACTATPMLFHGILWRNKAKPKLFHWILCKTHNSTMFICHWMLCNTHEHQRCFMGFYAKRTQTNAISLYPMHTCCRSVLWWCFLRSVLWCCYGRSVLRIFCVRSVLWCHLGSFSFVRPLIFVQFCDATHGRSVWKCHLCSFTFGMPPMVVQLCDATRRPSDFDSHNVFVAPGRARATRRIKNIVK